MTLEERFKEITTLVFDVDGVFTDGSLTITQNDATRTFNVRDGYAVQMAHQCGYGLAVISGGKQESIVSRMQALGIRNVYIGVGTAEKPRVLAAFLEAHQIAPEKVLYMGDDIPDLLVMNDLPVLACCPADAVAEVRERADYSTAAPGGRGAVREVIEKVMKARGQWMKKF